MPDVEAEIVEAIYDGDIDLVRRELHAHPEWVRGFHYGTTWLGRAADEPSIEMVNLLISLGCDVNERTSTFDPRRPLGIATAAGRLDVMRILVAHGADPNLGNPIVDAVLSKGQNPRELAQFLESHDANIHVIYPFGPNSVPMNALALAALYGKREMAEYLRSRGARMPEEYSKEEISAYLEGRLPTSNVELEPELESIVAASTQAYFAEHFGPIDPLSLIEIVPNDPQISIHFISADDSRKQITLFTMGLANVAMSVSANQPEAADYRHAELFLQLPDDWKYRDYEDPQYGWPVHWLRKIAQYAAAENEWLGGPMTIYDAGEPLGPGLEFDSWLLVAERQYRASDERTIQLYRLTPLYPEERDLEKREGIEALFRALDKQGTQFVIDLKRKNAVV